MVMEKFKFVDASFKEISLNETQKQSFAVDLGVRHGYAKRWLPMENIHFFVSACPWAKGLDKKEAEKFIFALKQRNPEVQFSLLNLEQIIKLNLMGNINNFQILDCWTSSYRLDKHGRLEGFCSLKDGQQIVDLGENKADVYVLFGFIPQQEKEIVFPE